MTFFDLFSSLFDIIVFIIISLIIIFHHLKHVKNVEKTLFFERPQKRQKNVKKGQKWPKSKNHEGGIMVPPKSSFFVKITFGKNPKKSENRPKIALFSGSQNPQKSTFFGPYFSMSTRSLRFLDVVILRIRFFFCYIINITSTHSPKISHTEVRFLLFFMSLK